MSTTLYYVHDPMCSWCYAYRPVLAEVHRILGNRSMKIVHLLGGLAPDSDQPMDEALQIKLQSTWREIEKETGTVFNHRFWRDCQPRRSTWPACRAVLAAQKQRAGEQMIDAIQHAYYQRAMNPSDEETLLQLADELNLDFDRFAQDLASPELDAGLQQQIKLVSSLPVDGFPSWVLASHGRYQRVPLDYHSVHVTLAAIGDMLQIQQQ